MSRIAFVALALGAGAVAALVLMHLPKAPPVATATLESMPDLYLARAIDAAEQSAQACRTVATDLTKLQALHEEQMRKQHETLANLQAALQGQPALGSAPAGVQPPGKPPRRARSKRKTTLVRPQPPPQAALLPFRW